MTFFPTGGDRYLQMEMTLPPGTLLDKTLTEVMEIEERVGGVAQIHTATIGVGDAAFGGTPGGLNQAGFFVSLSQDAPPEIANTLRDELQKPGRLLRITELSSGPPATGVEVTVTGPDYDDVASVSRELVRSSVPSTAS